MSKLILLVLNQGKIKAIWALSFTMCSRLNLALFGGIEKCVEGYEYVCLYIRCIYSEFTSRYNLIL